MTPADGDGPTVIGNVGSIHDVFVDRRGAVTVDDARWSLDWWVGAADRWHRPAHEAGTAVTQRRIDGVAVVETSLRVPRGQLVHRAWCVAGPDGDLALVELENRSQEPVAVAAVVKGATRVAFDGDRSVAVDGRVGVVLGRRPARAAEGDDGTVRALLEAGQGAAAGPLDARRSTVALVFPVAHTAVLRLALPLGTATAPTDLERLPDRDAVARGWRSHVDAGARVGMPDDGLAEAVVAARVALLVRPDRARPAVATAEVLAALDAWGHHDAAATVSGHLLGARRFGGRREPHVAAAVLAALGAHARATRDAAWAEPFVEAAARTAHRLGGRWVTAQHDAADLLDTAGQPDAAALCRARLAAAPLPSPASPPNPASLDVLRSLAQGVAGVDDLGSSRFLALVRDVLVDDTVPGLLTMLPAFPDEWLGREVEAHRLPTRAGLLSFALRWHGPRPALLWELHGGAATRLRCTGLDREWASDEPVGEALLGLVEPAGGLPKVVAPLGAGTPVDDAPTDGTSFR